MEALGRSSKVEFFSDGDEVAEMAEFDIAIIHMLEIIIRTNKILDVWAGSA